MGPLLGHMGCPVPAAPEQGAVPPWVGGVTSSPHGTTLQKSQGRASSGNLHGDPLGSLAPGGPLSSEGSGSLRLVPRQRHSCHPGQGERGTGRYSDHVPGASLAVQLRHRSPMVRGCEPTVPMWRIVYVSGKLPRFQAPSGGLGARPPQTGEAPSRMSTTAPCTVARRREQPTRPSADECGSEASRERGRCSALCNLCSAKKPGTKGHVRVVPVPGASRQEDPQGGSRLVSTRPGAGLWRGSRGAGLAP